MDKYYYFVSQLPSLQFNQKPHIERVYFLEQAQKWLRFPEFDILAKVNLDDFFGVKSDISVLKDYKDFEKRLRNEIALLRSAKKDKKSHQASSEIKLAVADASPLEAEIKLLLIRWKFIEEQQVGHNFDLAWLILYFLKLQILERLFTFNKEKGVDRFDQLCEVKL